MRVIAIGTLILITGMGLFNFGLEVGLRTRPVFDSSKYQEVGCNDIEPFEYGVKCIVFMDAEDSNVRIFKGEGALDD